MALPCSREDDQEKPRAMSPFPGLLFRCLAQHCNVVSPKRKLKRMQHGAGVPQGGTQPTQNLQPCGHFPNPLSQELPCSPPPDPSALREHDSSLHMPKYHRWPWDWEICPHPLPKIEPKPTCTSMAPTSMARKMSWSNAGAMKHQPNLHSIPFIPVPRAIPSEGGPAPWGRGTRSWLLLTYRYHHPKGHREEQHRPHSMPWLIPPEQSGDTAGLQGGTQKIWEHIKGFLEAEPTITMPKSSLVPAGIPMVPRVDLVARNSQATFHPLFQGAGLQPLLHSPHLPSSLPARLLQGAGIGAGKALALLPRASPDRVAGGSWRTAPSPKLSPAGHCKGLERGRERGQVSLFGCNRKF